MDHGTDEPDLPQNPQGTEIVESPHETSEVEFEAGGTTSFHQPSDLSSQQSSNEEASTPGSVFGRYKNLEFIGQGAMAKVYKADDPSLGRTVALIFQPGDRSA
jgi:hypothetical protein